MQEYHDFQAVNFKSYRYKYKKLKGKSKTKGQAIFSKYPIIKAGSVNFPDTFNNAIYADIVKGADTIRVYNIHLQSLKINPEIDKLRQEDSGKLYNQIGNTFAMQQSQAELFNEDLKSNPHKKIICGDFNNTQYANVYKQIKGDGMKDAFIEAGSGLGRTFNFKFFPVRIDFILADEAFSIQQFDNFQVDYSDHFPVMSTLSL
jgi:endonuclease/exonuclease/phosphatase family metal-dependent hydrolase